MTPPSGSLPRIKAPLHGIFSILGRLMGDFPARRVLSGAKSAELPANRVAKARASPKNLSEGRFWGENPDFCAYLPQNRPMRL